LTGCVAELSSIVDHRGVVQRLFKGSELIEEGEEAVVHNTKLSQLA
jgi:hypothetical protein